MMSPNLSESLSFSSSDQSKHFVVNTISPTNNDDDDPFRSTDGNAFESADDASKVSLESDQETQVVLEARKQTAESKKRSSSQAGKSMQPPKKKRSQKKKINSNRCCSSSYSADELLLNAKAFMKVSTNTKHSTDKKAKKFWDEVYTCFEELVATANKMNKSHPEFFPIEPGHGVESIRNCWQR
jgi:hypothetical protein